jgi:hypothetical protein
MRWLWDWVKDGADYEKYEARVKEGHGWFRVPRSWFYGIRWAVRGFGVGLIVMVVVLTVLGRG